MGHLKCGRRKAPSPSTHTQTQLSRWMPCCDQGLTPLKMEVLKPGHVKKKKEISSKPVNMLLIFFLPKYQGEDICENTIGQIHLRCNSRGGIKHVSGLIILSKHILAKDTSPPFNTL